MPHRIGTPSEEISGSLAEDIQCHIPVGMRVQEFESLSNDVGIIGSAQASIRSNNYELDFFIAPYCQQGMRLLGNAGCQAVENRDHLTCIWARGYHAIP